MSKFHINKHGVPAPCKATKGNCPLGGNEQHFNSEEEAQAFIDNQMESKHGLLGGTPSEKEEMTNLEKMKNKLQKMNVKEMARVMAGDACEYCIYEPSLCKANCEFGIEEYLKDNE